MIELSKQNKNNVNVSEGKGPKRDFSMQLQMPNGELVATKLNSPKITKQDIEPYRYLLKDATKIIIPEGVKEIDWGVEHLKNVEEIHFPRSLEKIGSFCFAGCEKIQSLDLNDGLKEIGTSAFSDCKNLEYIRIPSTIEKIGDHAFENCTKIISVIYIPSKTSIGAHVFQGCENITINIYKPTKYHFTSIHDQE